MKNLYILCFRGIYFLQFNEIITQKLCMSNVRNNKKSNCEKHDSLQHNVSVAVCNRIEKLRSKLFEKWRK